jgi:hypothetical protein
MEKKTGSYGWTPQQMERVNARRQARGQEQLLNANTGNQEGADNYNKYYGEVQKKSNKPVGITKSKYDIDKEKESGTSLSKRIKGRDTAFEEKFGKKRMLPQGMGGMKSGISSPSTRQGYTMIG